MTYVFRYLGDVDGVERVGVELRDRQGDTDGSIAKRRYFTWYACSSIKHTQTLSADHEIFLLFSANRATGSSFLSPE